MRRADRLYRLLDLLRDGRLTTARALAEMLEVSERTIYRDVADLMASGVPIEGEAGVGYVMRPGFDLPPLMFDRAEVEALALGARLVEAWGGSAMAGAAAAALAKIAAVVPEGTARAAEAAPLHAFRSPEMDPATRDRLDLIDRAIHEGRALRLSYRDADGAATLRTVLPLALVFWGRVWTLVGWCRLRDDFRMFRVDRMAGAEAGAPDAPAPHQTLAAFYAREACLAHAVEGVTPPRASRA